MPSLILIVFTLNLLIHLINSFGATAINDFAWNLYQSLILSSSPSSQKSAQLKQDLFKIKKELASVSAQDDFAKWARIRRQHDRAEAAYNAQTQSQSTSHTTFNRIISTLRTVSTTGLRLLLQFWHSKTPMFWLPAGWVPWYVEWILSFPRAPMGSVSIQVWGIACVAVVKMVSEAVVAGWKLYQRSAISGGKKGVEVKLEGLGKDVGRQGEGNKMRVGAGGGVKKEL